MNAKTILIQEPSPEIQELYRTILRDCGAEPVFVHSHEEIPAALNRHAHSLAIVDQSGPDATGLALVEWLNTVAPRLPVILVSTVTLNSINMGRLERSGYNAFLRKPFDIKLLRECVEKALAARTAASTYAHSPDLMRIAV